LIVRQHTAERINELLNDETIRPWVSGPAAGVIDLHSVVSDPKNVVLMGDYGGCVFFNLQPGVYEVHTQVLPVARGEWTRKLTEACARYMFTKTDAYEVVTRIPVPHAAARAAAEAQGMRHEFRRVGECIFRGQQCDVDIYSFRLQDWAPRAVGMERIGAWLHDRMEQEAARLGINVPTHGEDQNHNQYVGLCAEMAFGGQYGKGIAMYNRWVSLVRHTRDSKLQHVSLVSEQPLVIRFDIGLMKFSDDDIEVIREC
jgi:hypothetical protein